MEQPSAEQARLYLASLQGGDGVPDELYLALLDHAQTPEARMASRVLVFHRGVGNGGLAQALSNERGDAAAILDAFEQLGPQAEPAKAVLVEAVALHRSLPEEPDQKGDAWDRYQVAYEAAEDQWDLLDNRYRGVTYPVVRGDDLLEKAVLAYALAHPAAFSAVVEAAK